MKIMKFTLTLLSIFLVSMTRAQTTSPAPYCNGAFDDAGGFNVPDAIKSVSIGTLNNNSGGQYSGGHYVFYNNLAAPVLTKGTSLPLNIVFEVHGGAGYGVWIDFNKNNTFEANEKVAGSTATGWLNISNNTTVSPSISIPATAQTGATRMRVRIVEDDDYTMANGAAILPCNASTSATDVMDWGETEDYTVTIADNGAGNKPQAAFTANPVTGTVNNTVISLTDNSTNTPTAWKWTFTPNTVAYQGTSASTSSNPSVKFTATGTYSVKLVVSNAAGKDSITKSAYITITSGATAVEELNQSNALHFYPNPSNGIFYVDPVCQGARIVITDISGKVYSNLENFSGNKLDMSSFRNGQYFIKVIKDSKTFHQKVFIAR